MSENEGKNNLARFLGFCKRTLIFAGGAVALSLAIWLVISLFQGHFGSPAGALFLGGILLFILAMLPFFFDMAGTLLIPFRTAIQKKDARQILKEDRPRSEAGISLTFQLAAAGVLLLLLSYLAGRLFGG